MHFNDPFDKDDEACAKAVLYEKFDPFNSIPCSLLASAEIHDYAKTTGMLCPYHPKQLKSASYEAHIGGEVIWWDEAGTKIRRIVKRGEELILKPNSIVFVQVEPLFRLPYYIAIRFNLRIHHVHRGLLLGTGPLVDPGFHGKLLIPLHNLTATEYSIDTREALIWIEFTKTTFGCVVKESLASPERLNIDFPKDKRDQEPETYLRKANGANAIRSSIPDAIEDARRSAKAAKDEIDSIKRIGFWAGIGASITFIGMLVGLYLQVGQMVQNANSLVSTIQQTIVPLSGDAKVGLEKMAGFQAQIDLTNRQVDLIRNDVAASLKPKAKAESGKKSTPKSTSRHRRRKPAP